MKLSHILIGIATLATLTAAAEENKSLMKISRDTTVCGLSVQNAQMQRNAGVMKVVMNLGLEDFDLDGQRAAIFSPLIVNGEDTVRLQPVGLYSRTRWYQYLRAGEKPLGGSNEQSIRWSERPSEINYSQVVDYQEWMNGSELMLERCDYGCCHTLLDKDVAGVAGYKEVYFTPVFRYVKPEADAVKMRELSGRAFIDFPVNRTEIYPDYRNNPAELKKIIATIDSVRNDSDVTVREITIKGYASPEGSYANNTRLAKGRTEALKQYVGNLYRFESDFIATDYEPEDWEGLREYVEGSNLAHRAEILAIIDSDMEPDPKNTKIQTTYPEEYRFLLQTVYPGLRHSDYTIEYTIRQFSEPAEIEKIFSTQPQKLSLEEMFVLARSCEEGSDKYNEVFETAVRMYPNDLTANLNAANAAMGRGDLDSAEKYLSKAGGSAEAEYARGMLKALRGDYDGALESVKAAEAAGMTDTGAVESNLIEVKSYNNK